uniref:Odorant receptor n=1 Tax=Semiothisa cinerearia TaxID=2249628 RepID=A0A889XLE3_9NEOP|nr:odorant receptor [Semiothisa cinerearia]
MQQISHLDKTLNGLEILNRYAGIYIKSGNNTNVDRFKYRCLYLSHSFAANYQLFCSIIWCINGVRNGEDFIAITYTIPCLTISVLAQFKGIFLIKNEKRADELIAKLKNLDEKEKKRAQSEEKDEIVKSEWKFLNYVLKTLSIFYTLLVAGFSISPLVVIALNYFQTKEVELILPFFAIYGYDPFRWMIWPFVYLHQCWSELAVVLNISAADYFFFTCCIYIRIQFRLLKYDLENIIHVEKNSNKLFVENEMFRNHFNELVKWHQDLIESVDILEIIYSKSTLFNFFSSSLIICLTGFNVTIVHDATNMMTFTSFLFVSLVQVFCLCFFADLLMTSSMNIGEGIYNSNLYMAEPKVAKKLLLILTRSQKPCKITASGYADVNLKSFMRVLSTAWSYFALLQTMYGN